MIYYLNKQGKPVDPNGNLIKLESEADDLVTESTGAADGTVTNDDLTAIKGIGPARAKELAQYGINSFQRLATADLDELATAMEVSPDKLAAWQNEAAQLVQA